MKGAFQDFLLIFILIMDAKDIKIMTFFYRQKNLLRPKNWQGKNKIQRKETKETDARRRTNTLNHTKIKMLKEKSTRGTLNQETMRR